MVGGMGCFISRMGAAREKEIEEEKGARDERFVASRRSNQQPGRVLRFPV